MRKAVVLISTLMLLSGLGSTPAHALTGKAKISKPSAPLVLSVSSSVPKRGKVNVTVSISLPASNGGSNITGTKVSAGGKSCVIKKRNTSCTLKGVKSGKKLTIRASSKNKKGYGTKSPAVRYVAGGPVYSLATPVTAIPVSSNPAPTSAPTPAPVTSLCTITGTSGDDYLVGTNSNDVICGNGGRDTILALAGNDVIYAGEFGSVSTARGARSATGLSGIRLLSSDSVGDVIDGGDGEDTIHGGSGSDAITGGTGNDSIYGGSGNDELFGEQGNDIILGDSGDDEISGGPDVDTIDGGEGSNTCFGGDSESEITSCRYESTGPEITSVTASPSTVSPGQILTISIDVNDPSGINYVGFSFSRDGVQRDFCGQSTQLTSGTSTNGTWTYECTVPTLVLNGSYEITPFARDMLGSYTNTNGGTLDSTRGSVSVSGGYDDVTGPEITSVTASPSTVSPGQILTISIDVNDPSGINYVGFSFSRDGVQRDFCGQSTQLTSGTSTNGTWTYECTVPANTVIGEYVVTPYAKDNLGNYTNTNGGTLSPTRGSFTLQ